MEPELHNLNFTLVIFFTKKCNYNLLTFIKIISNFRIVLKILDG